MMVGFKLLGFVKQAIMAYYYGATIETDIYLVAFGFISAFGQAVLRAVSVSSLSSYALVKEKKGRAGTKALISNLITIFVLLCGAVILIFSLCAPVIARLLAPTYDGPQRELLEQYIAILSPVLVFMVFETVLGAVLNGEKKFGVIRTQSLIYSLAVIAACVFFSKAFGISALIAAQYVSYILFTIFVIYAAHPYISFRPSRPLLNEDVRTILVQAIPLLLGNAVLQLNNIIDRVITSSLGEGAVSALYYCHILEQLVTAVLIVETGNIIFSYFASMTAKNETGQIVTTLNQSLLVMVMLLIPISAITVVESREIVSIVYFRGSFSQDAVLLTATALAGYAISFPCVAVRDFFVKSSYAYQDTKGPMRTGVAAMTINIILSVMLFRLIGILGVALGTSIANLIGAILAEKNFKRNEPTYDFKPIRKQMVQLVIFGITLFPVLILVRNQMAELPDIASFAACTVIGFTIYAIELLVFRNPTAMHLLHVVKKRRKHSSGV